MKKGNFSIFFVIAISMFSSSCRLSEKRNNEKIGAASPEAVAIDTLTNSEIEAAYRILPLDQQLILWRISTVTDPEDAYQIYLHAYVNRMSTEVEDIAYAKWEELMVIKIDTMTDPEEVYRIYLDLYGEVIESAAYQRYKKLGGKN
ncbi:MAG: hypothetical protein V4665_01035 [Patescibacteria group bacterium]